MAAAEAIAPKVKESFAAYRQACTLGIQLESYPSAGNRAMKCPFIPSGQSR